MPEGGFDETGRVGLAALRRSVLGSVRRRRRASGGCDGKTHCAPLLKTLPAINGTALCGLKRDSGLLPALGANRLGFNALNTGGTVALRASRFARLAALRFVLKALIGEKHLFAGSEDKFRTAIGTLQDPIMVFHTLLQARTGRGQAAIASRQQQGFNLIGEPPNRRLGFRCVVWKFPSDMDA